MILISNLFHLKTNLKLKNENENGQDKSGHKSSKKIYKYVFNNANLSNLSKYKTLLLSAL